MSDKRVLVDWLLDAFECRYKDKWQEERFSVLGDADCGHKRADLDFIFFWKIYDRWSFARQSGKVFGQLCHLAGGGPKMVRIMAAISPDHAEHLKDAVEKKVLSPEILQEPFAQVRGGWQVLGCAVKAAKQLHELYPVEETSYVGRWLAKFICNEQWTGNWQDLVDCINSEVEREIRDIKNNWQLLPCATRGLLEERLLHSEAHLPGSGPETLGYFFRDWRDIILWKYMWKHDQKNQDFWHLAYKILGPIEMGPTGKEMQTVLDFLGSCLSQEEIEGGALARVNTAVYRLMSAYGHTGIETRLRNLAVEKR